VAFAAELREEVQVFFIAEAIVKLHQVWVVEEELYLDLADDLGLDLLSLFLAAVDVLLAEHFHSSNETALFVPEYFHYYTARYTEPNLPSPIRRNKEYSFSFGKPESDLQLGGCVEKLSLVLPQGCGSEHAIGSRFNFLAGRGSLASRCFDSRFLLCRYGLTVKLFSEL
jgi:hypothetical protein